MKNYKRPTAWMLIMLIAFSFLLPATAPVYASSLTDSLKSTISNQFNGASEASSGSSFINILLGLLMGKVLGNMTIPQDSGNIDFPSKTTNSQKELIGFYAEWWGTDTSSFNSLSKNTDVIKTIAPFWTTLEEDATVTDRGGNDHDSVVKFAHQNNVSVLLLVNNAKKSGDISPIHKILSSPSLRTNAINNLEAYIKKYNLDGINVDFEMVDAQDRDNLSSFMKELSLRLKPQGYIISIDVFPKQDESNDVSIAYDYAQLAKYADKIMIMTYDNHGTWSKAGPIADINWVESNLKYALKFIPKNKVYIGIAAYGYDWSSKGVESLEYGAIMNLVQQFNSSVVFDKNSKSPYFDYTGADGISHQVWYENSESLKYKLDLVNKYDIAGAAMWKLGEEDPTSWKTLKTVFSRK